MNIILITFKKKIIVSKKIFYITLKVLSFKLQK